MPILYKILKTAFLPDETREWVATLANQHQSRGGGGQKKVTMATVSTDKTEPASTGSVGKRKAKHGARKSRRGKAKDRWNSDENDNDEEEEEEEEEEGGAAAPWSMVGWDKRRQNRAAYIYII